MISVGLYSRERKRKKIKIKEKYKFFIFFLCCLLLFYLQMERWCTEVCRGYVAKAWRAVVALEAEAAARLGNLRVSECLTFLGLLGRVT